MALVARGRRISEVEPDFTRVGTHSPTQGQSLDDEKSELVFRRSFPRGRETRALVSHYTVDRAVGSCFYAHLNPTAWSVGNPVFHELRHDQSEVRESLGRERSRER